MKDIKIPDEVVDREAYLAWLKLQNSPLINDENSRLLKTSDVNLIIDTWSNYNTLKKKIEHLPDEEQKFISAKCMAVHCLRGEIAKKAKQAWGTFKAESIEITNALEPRKTEILELFGSYHSVDDVHKILNHEWELPIPKSMVQRFAIANSDKIKELQEVHRRDYSHVRLGYKRSRLEEYSYMYQRNKELLELCDFENIKIQETNLKILSAIKSEVEGNELNVNINGNINVTHLLETYVNSEIFSQMPVQAVVLSKIAARFNVDPRLMMYRLQSSIYAKTLGIVQTDTNLNDIKQMFPSEHVYEFDKLKALNARINATEAQIVSDIKSNDILPVHQLDEAEEMRQKLLSKIANNKEDVNKSRVRIMIRKSKSDD